MNRTKTKRRPSRLLALCLSLTVALGLLTVPVAAVDYQEGIDEYYEGHSTQQFGNNHLIFNVPVRYYDTAAGENVYSNTLQVSGVLMMDGLEEVAVTCGELAVALFDIYKMHSYLAVCDSDCVRLAVQPGHYIVGGRDKIKLEYYVVGVYHQRKQHENRENYQYDLSRGVFPHAFLSALFSCHSVSPSRGR